jgi:hypothetical protein
VPHRGLGRPQRDSALGEQRAKGRPQGMDVEGAAPLVGFGIPANSGSRSKILISASGTSKSGVSAGRRVGIGSPRRRASSWRADSWSDSH